MPQPGWDGLGGLQDQAWNFVWLGGLLLPGLSVVDCPRSRSIEKKKTQGTDGTKITDQGDELTPVKIRTEVYTLEQWEQWQAIIPAIYPRKTGATREPLEIIHPMPAVLGISAVYVEKLHIHPPEKQVLVIEIDAFDWSPEVRALAVSSTASGAAPVKQTGTTQTDPTREFYQGPDPTAGPVTPEQMQAWTESLLANSTG